MLRYMQITILVVGLVLASALQAAAGTISGTVKVRGLRSPENILIYLTRIPTPPLDLQAAEFVMDQQELTFLPHILPVPVGAAVAFPNNDEVEHNVFSLSRTKNFNLGSYKPGESQEVTFDKPGVVEIRCDLHAEMLAYIMVMKNPYYAVTDTNGAFVIPDRANLARSGVGFQGDIPPGTYLLKAWHEKLKTTRQRVEVPEQGQVEIQLELTRGTASSVLYK